MSNSTPVKALVLLAAIVFFSINVSAAQTSLAVPHSTTAIMVDGKLSGNEWRDAAHIDVPGVARLSFKQAYGFVYIAVEYTKAPSGIVDLYIAPGDGSIHDLHASAKLGERALGDNAWPDWTWWNNRDWVANVARVDSWDKRTFLPEPVREYQVLRSRFPTKEWRVRFELTAMNGTAVTQSAVFPEKASDKDPAHWLVLRLD